MSAVTYIADVELNLIRTDGDTQSREGLTGSVVYDYAECMKAGDKFPEIEVYWDEADTWLADGFHRVAAAKEAGLTTIRARVHHGTRRDAVLHGVSANNLHGLQPTRADRRHAAEKLLIDEEWGQWSDREIARLTGLSHPTVSNIRAELVRTGKINHSDERKGADGRTISTTNIGSAGGKQHPKPNSSDPYMRRIYDAWREQFPKDKLMLIQAGEYYLAFMQDDALLRGTFGYVGIECGHIGLSGSADHSLVSKIDGSYITALEMHGKSFTIVNFTELDEDMQFVAGKAKNARNIPLNTFHESKLLVGTERNIVQFITPNAQIFITPDTAWYDRYWLLHKRYVRDGRLLFASIKAGALFLGDCAGQVYRTLDDLRDEYAYGTHDNPDIGFWVIIPRDERGGCELLPELWKRGHKALEYKESLVDVADLQRASTIDDQSDALDETPTASADEQPRRSQWQTGDEPHPFKVGDLVLIEGSDIPGKVVGLRSGMVCVTRPNPQTPNINMTHWVKHGKVSYVPDAAEPAPEETPSAVLSAAEQPAEPAFTYTPAPELPISDMDYTVLSEIRRHLKIALMNAASISNIDRLIVDELTHHLDCAHGIVRELIEPQRESQ